MTSFITGPRSSIDPSRVTLARPYPPRTVPAATRADILARLEVGFRVGLFAMTPAAYAALVRDLVPPAEADRPDLIRRLHAQRRPG